MLTDRLSKRKLHRELIEIQLIECVLLIMIFLISYDLSWGIIYHNFLPFILLQDHLRHILFFVSIVIILSFSRYFNVLHQTYAEAIKRILVAGLLMNVIFIMLLYFTSNVKISAYYFIAAYIFQIILLIIFRTFAELFCQLIKQSNSNLVIIKDYTDSDFLKALQKNCKGKMFVVTFEKENLKEYVEKADNIYLACSLTKELENEVLSYCAIAGKRTYIIPKIFQIMIKNSSISFIGDIPVFELENFQLSEAQKFVKRLIDILFSIIGIVVALPVFLIVPILIKLEDHGPVFYMQERSGLKGESFQLIKFRSMVVDAEKNTGAVLATENDWRITKIGAFMRSARIDEIPQFFNVLAGSMSLVGPRPERPVFVEKYNKELSEYQYRQSVKPGITGLAQIKGNYTTTAEHKIKLDLMYLMNYSLLLDIKILFKTVKVVLSKEQARGFSEKERQTKEFDTKKQQVRSYGLPILFKRG